MPDRRMWTCPRCDRQFATKRAHVCEPGMPVEVWLAERPDGQRRAAEAVLAILRRHRDLIIEAVGVGIFVKRERSIIELRPKTRWLDLSFISPVAIMSDKIAREVQWPAGRAYFVHLRDERDVDADLRRWLTDAVVRTSRRSRTRARPASRRA